MMRQGRGPKGPDGEASQSGSLGSRIPLASLTASFVFVVTYSQVQLNILVVCWKRSNENGSRWSRPNSRFAALSLGQNVARALQFPSSLKSLQS